MRGKKRLTPQEFETIRPYLSRLKERNVQALQQILVDGRTQTETAGKLGVTNKAVSQMVSKAWQFHLDHGNRPIGWVSISVALPPDMADMVKDLERKARERENLTNKDRSCEATIYPFVGRARSGALGGPPGNIFSGFTPEAWIPESREQEVPAGRCLGGEDGANRAKLAL